MVKKLLSSLIAKTGWRLLFKALAGFIALLFAGLVGFSFWGIVVFLAVSFWLYFSEGAERTNRRTYFWLLAVWALVAGTVSSGLLFYLVSCLYFALLYLWLGDVRLLWPNRALTADIGEAGLFAFSAALLFELFPGARQTSFWGGVGFLLAVFALSAILVREAFRSAPERFFRRERLAAWAIGLILAETAALLAFLPLGFLNAAAALTLVFVVLRDVLLAHSRGLLNNGYVFREITILTVFLVLIFAVVPWVLG